MYILKEISCFFFVQLAMCAKIHGVGLVRFADAGMFSRARLPTRWIRWIEKLNCAPDANLERINMSDERGGHGALATRAADIKYNSVFIWRCAHSLASPPVARSTNSFGFASILIRIIQFTGMIDNTSIVQQCLELSKRIIPCVDLKK